jgi:16S rRNA (uracil1498-N3)-methyltransferase
MRRFYLESERAPRAGDVVMLDMDESHHLLHVLRGEAGRALELVDGAGHLMSGLLVGREGKVARVEVTGVEVAEEEAATPRLVVACAVVKGKRFEFMVEKAVELGAHIIVPLKCDRGVIDPRDGKLDRWRGVLVGALKQSDRCWLPELAPLSTPEAVVATAAGPCFYGAVPVGGERSLSASTAAARAARRREAGEALPSSLTVLIGPEGDWSMAEAASLRQSATALDLGPHVLRTETAALAGLVALQEIRRAWRLDPSGEPA